MDRKVYAIKHKSHSVISRSSSGGAFTAISDYFIDNDYVVIGAKYDYKSHTLRFSLASSKEERNLMRGSKYIQCDSENLFELLDNAVIDDNNKKIMIIGVPCQIDAIRKYITFRKYDEERFFLCDIICHGVSSPELWREYIKDIEYKFNENVTYITFKDKRNTWKCPTAVVKTENREILISDYSKLYFSNNIMRPSCYKCKYASIKRVGDVTIGDYWGIENVMSDFYDKEGVSLMLINTKKGMDIFEKIKGNIEYRESKIEDCLQPNLISPTSEPILRKRVWQDKNNKGCKYIIKKYINYGGGNRYFKKIYKIINRL